MRRSLLLVALAAGCASTSKEAVPDKPVSASETRQAAGPTGRKQPGEILTELDLDKDGKTDVWRFSRRTDDGRELLVRVERDLNGDGKVDAWEEYGPEGELVKQVYDLDFDGRPDVTLFFEKGQLVRKEYAFGFDGKVRAWVYYEKGKRVRRERDLNGDGKVDYWEYWEGDQIDRIGVDLDGDGTVDRWENRRALAAAPAEAQPATAAQPAAPAPKR